MRVHCCLFDRQCLRFARLYGMPLRLHVGGWSLTLLANNRRSARLWEEAYRADRIYSRDPETGRFVNRAGEEYPRDKWA